MRFVLALFLASTITALAADPLKLSFVSENQQIVPGKTFSVGLFQQMQPGYHSYWKNPGTVGMGMSVEWDLPEGFQAGEIQWPTPTIGRMAVYDIWGYHKEAFLVVDITPPPNLQPGTEITLRGTAIWMCCGKSCFPGNQKIALTLPIAASSKVEKRWASRFAKTRAEQAVNSPDWQLSCRSSQEKYELTIAPAAGQPQPPGNIRFFDYDRQISSEKGQRVKQRRQKTVVLMRAEEHTGEKLPRLRGILVADTEWQAGARVIAVDVPIVRK